MRFRDILSVSLLFSLMFGKHEVERQAAIRRRQKREKGIEKRERKRDKTEKLQFIDCVHLHLCVSVCVSVPAFRICIGGCTEKIVDN